MPNIVVQDLPKYGQPLDPVVFTAADAAGDSFDNAEDVILWVQFGAAPSGNVVVEGVVSPDSGLDGSVTITAAANEDHMCGPFKGSNFNEGGQVMLTYPGGVTNIDVAVIRFTSG